MKKINISILLLVLSISAFAHGNIVNSTIKRIKTNELITSVKLYNNVEVILTENISEIEIVGECSAIDATNISIKNGELVISNMQECHEQKVIIYVPSKAVETVYVHGNGTVTSNTVLSNEIMDITINGEGSASVRSAGMISFNTIKDPSLESVQD